MTGIPPTSGSIPFAPDRDDGDGDTEDRMSSAEADAVASGVDPEDLGLDEDARPEEAEEEDS